MINIFFFDLLGQEIGNLSVLAEKSDTPTPNFLFSASVPPYCRNDTGVYLLVTIHTTNASARISGS